MSNKKCQLEQIVYGRTTALMLDDLGSHEDGFSAYNYLCELARKGGLRNNQKPDGLVLWAPFESWDWLDVLDYIENESEELLYTIKNVLSLAHKGIVQSAIDGTLDSDMNMLDLIAMIEKAKTSEFR